MERFKAAASPWLAVFVVAQIGATLLFAWLAITQRDWLAALLCVVAAGGAVWHTSILFRIRRARTEGATVLRDTGGAGPAASPSVTKATHSRGARSRSGFIVVVANTAAFVPTTPWRHLLWRLVGALLIIRLPLVRITLARLPRTPEELVALAQAEDGFLIDESWGWDPSGRLLIRTGGREVLMSRLPPQHAARWTILAADPAARKRTIRTILMGSLAAAAALAGLGALVWRLTGNIDFLISGLFFAGLLAVSAAIGIGAASRKRPDSK